MERPLTQLTGSHIMAPGKQASKGRMNMTQSLYTMRSNHIRCLALLSLLSGYGFIEIPIADIHRKVGASLHNVNNPWTHFAQVHALHYLALEPK
jgi:hypothetical protein